MGAIFKGQLSVKVGHRGGSWALIASLVLRASMGALEAPSRYVALDVASPAHQSRQPWQTAAVLGGGDPSPLLTS